MSFTKFLLLLVMAGSVYHFWYASDSKPSKTEDVSPYGFVELPAPTNLDFNTVIVLAAKNCRKDEARYADYLADELRRRHIPCTRTDSAQFDATIEPDVVGRLNSVMDGPTPIVFVRGRGKANPSLDEVLAEYELSKPL